VWMNTTQVCPSHRCQLSDISETEKGAYCDLVSMGDPKEGSAVGVGYTGPDVVFKWLKPDCPEKDCSEELEALDNSWQVNCAYKLKDECDSHGLECMYNIPRK